VTPAWLRVVPGGIEVDVWVVPGAARSAVTGLHDGRLRLAVAAPPSEGRANRAVEALLASVAGVASRRVGLVRGDRGRAKTCRIATGEGAGRAGDEPGADAVVARLVAAAAPGPVSGRQ